MNRTQRVAVWVIAIIFLSMVLLALVLIPIFFFGRCTPPPIRIACMATLVAVSLGGLFFAIRKQREVETDEMGIAIQKIAAILSLVTVFVLIGISLIAANLVWGLNFAVPLWVLMLLFGALLVIGCIVYWGAVMVQYSWKEKSNE